jgi:hypothetical protein
MKPLLWSLCMLSTKLCPCVYISLDKRKHLTSHPLVSGSESENKFLLTAMCQTLGAQTHPRRISRPIIYVRLSVCTHVASRGICFYVSQDFRSDIQGYYKWFIRFQNSFLALSPFSKGTEFLQPTGAHITNLVSLRFVSYINRICTYNTLDNIAFWKRMNHL